MSRPPKTPSKTASWQTDDKPPRPRGPLIVWVDPSMQWDAILLGRRPRQKACAGAAIQACLIFKALLRPTFRQGVPLVLRHWRGFVASLPEPSGLDWSGTDVNTLSRPLPGRRDCKMQPRGSGKT
ncbi:transposase [Salipiger pallidus]|uniref:transposase n=1 Tax=Salipiger pallidus TaxID=1775170 RepID=UPI003570D7C1